MSKELFYQKQVMNPYPTDSQSHTAYEKGFVEGYQKSEETLYTEEQAREIWRAGQEYWKTSGASITFEELTEKLKQK